MDHHPDRAAVLAGLRARWGSAAPRPATEVFGALAAAPLPAEAGAADALSADRVGLVAAPGAVPAPLDAPPAASPGRPALLPLPGGAEARRVPLPGDPARSPAPSLAPRPLPGDPARSPASSPGRDLDRTIPTGFTELDALLAGGGLPRAGTVGLRGAGSSGATTLALRAAAEAQAGGALVAWVDCSRSFDPVEAVARGVRLEWLAVLVPAGVDEALAMAGTLLQARAVDLLVLDLAGGSGRRGAGGPARAGGQARPTAGIPAVGARRATGGPAATRRPPPFADRLARLVAFARRAGALLLVLEPTEAPGPVRAALAEGSNLALELRRTGWIRLGREVVGQRTEVRVAKDRRGAPDRRTTFRLLYAEGGPRDRCLARDELLAEEPVAGGVARSGTGSPIPATPVASATFLRPQEPDRSTDAPSPPRRPPPRTPARPGARFLDSRDRAADPRRAAVG